jgi:hypothetical protein
MKAEFSNVDQLSNWLSDVVNPMKYDVYYETLDRRCFAIKNVSTEPRLHGVVNNVDIGEIEDVADSYNRTLTVVKSFEWEHEATTGNTDL